MKTFGLVILVIVLMVPNAVSAGNRPNFVWIVSEDNSMHYLDLFVDGGASTPHIESLAKQGLTFRHAFSNAPVCSVARTTLATSCYAPRIGTQFHRKYKPAAMPGGLRMFHAYLKDAGYYTSNNSKTDYNVIPSGKGWNESSKKASWRNRPDESQPFFHMQTFAQSHEGRLHFDRRTFDSEKTKHDPSLVKLAPYLPDLPLVRYTHALYLDRMAIIDAQVGNVINMLRDDGLLEETYVFYFGDHGGVLPRSKGYVYESGLHIPLVVRIPKKFKQLAGMQPGTTVDGFVDFVDFGPTVLNLAGVPLPDLVDGRPFLGPGLSLEEVNERDTSFGYADRFDEKYDQVRSIRKGRYQYIRSYQPYLPDGLQNNYRYRMLAYKAWRQKFQDGDLSGTQRAFFQPKPIEMLFDVDNDPHQVSNLAADPVHRDTLMELRGLLTAKVKSLPDLSFFPESYLVDNAIDDAVAFGASHRDQIGRLVDTANLALMPFDEISSRLKASLASPDPFVRYWGAMVCTAFGREAIGMVEDVRPLLADEQEIVRVRAIEFLGLVGAIEPQQPLIEIVNATRNPVLATETLNSIVWFRDCFGDRFSVRPGDLQPVCTGAGMENRLSYLKGKTGRKKRRSNKQ